MNVMLLVAALSLPPAPTPASVDMQALFDRQQKEILHDMHAGLRSDLQARSARFFAEGGELQQLLRRAALADASLAAR